MSGWVAVVYIETGEEEATTLAIQTQGVLEGAGLDESQYGISLWGPFPAIPRVTFENPLTEEPLTPEVKEDE